MRGKRRLQKSLEGLDTKKADTTNIIFGILGFIINGRQMVEVPGRLGYVYVRIRDTTNEVVQAYNSTVSSVYGLPVQLIRDPNDSSRYLVQGRDLARYKNWGTTTPYLPRHGWQHSFHERNSGGDITWIYGRQFMPLGVFPSGTYGAPNVYIQGGAYYWQGSWRYSGNTGTANLIGLNPTGTYAKMILIYLDSNGNPDYIEGNEFSVTITGTAEILPYVPELPSSSGVPLGAVRLVSGTSVIHWRNIYDLRPMIVGDSFIPTGAYSGWVVQDEGVDLPLRLHLNFVGTNVYAEDDAGNNAIKVTVSGSAGGSKHIIQDEGVSETDRANLNFVGAGVFVEDDAGNDATKVIITGSTPRHIIQDEGTPETDRANLNFTGNGVFVEDDAGNNATKVIISGSTGGGSGAPPGTVDANTTNYTDGYHTHMVSGSSNPGANKAILMTDTSGYLRLQRLGIGVSPSNPLHIRSTTDAQMRIGYGTSNYSLFRQIGDGYLVLTVTGSSAGLLIRATQDLDNRYIQLALTGPDPNNKKHCIQFLGGYGGEFEFVPAGASLPATPTEDCFVINSDLALYTTEGYNPSLRIQGGLGVGNGYLTGTAVGCAILDQGAGDSNIIELRSSDVSHAFTSLDNPSAFGISHKYVGSSGGLKITGYTETNVGISINGFGSTDSVGKSTTSVGYIVCQAAKDNGSGGATGAGTNANLLVIRNYTNTRFIFDAEGSAHADVEWITFDKHDDIGLMTSLEKFSGGDPILGDFGQFVEYNREDLEQLGLAHFDDKPGHAMINFTKLAMVHNGGLRRQAQKLAQMEQQLELMKQTLLDAGLSIPELLE